MNRTTSGTTPKNNFQNESCFMLWVFRSLKLFSMPVHLYFAQRGGGQLGCKQPQIVCPVHFLSVAFREYVHRFGLDKLLLKKLTLNQKIKTPNTKQTKKQKTRTSFTHFWQLLLEQ